MPQFALSELPKIPVWKNVDVDKFHSEIAPLGLPAVLRGLVSDWPVVARGIESPQALSEYISGFGPNVSVTAFCAKPDINGRFFYSDDMKGFNFERRDMPLGTLLDKLISHLDDESPPCIAAGGVALENQLANIVKENPNNLLDPSVRQIQAMWIGNRGRTAAHWDVTQNIACVVGGRRRFTLIPPGQIANLYVGPVDFTLAGQPLSLVDFHDPDYDRFPRFEDALAAAQVAEMEPGDAIYIPSMWYHHVESLENFNILINFWWRDAQQHMFTPFFTMLHALLSMRDLPEHEKEAWRVMFDHYIFERDGDPMEHVPEHARGTLGELTPERIEGLRTFLIRQLGGQVPKT